MWERKRECERTLPLICVSYACVGSFFTFFPGQGHDRSIFFFFAIFNRWGIFDASNVHRNPPSSTPGRVFHPYMRVLDIRSSTPGYGGVFPGSLHFTIHSSLIPVRPWRSWVCCPWDLWLLSDCPRIMTTLWIKVLSILASVLEFSFRISYRLHTELVLVAEIPL